MTKSLLIGEVSYKGSMLPVYVTPRAAAETLFVSSSYTGYDDRADRSLVLLAHIDEALRSNQTKFSHAIPDPNWSGDPDKIESSRTELAISVGDASITLDLNIRSINKSDPRFAGIAANALNVLKAFDRRREIL